ncbi:MAG: M48 family metallopeptidase [Acinetobacter populi]|jgi:Zn-dependent protease with chaperone function|uniref:M48 family metallopeptidase n=1 Tax=Acinetobacter populi TaxID=1582270 RepID=UPI0023540DDA|nr:M48 family metallopeptidase [Acinetobacter populi]MCH4246368.1 M48 family metallopeptidase [Acinetobacter populi]
MMTSTQIHYYDGKINHVHLAELSPHPQGAIVRYGNEEKLYTFDQMTYIGALGKILPVIELPHDARIEFLTADVPEWLQLKQRKLSERVHKIEGSWRWIAVSFVAMVVVVVTTFKWGIPFAAHEIAMQLPEKTLNTLGDQAQQFIIDQTEKSELTPQRQQQIRALYQNNIQATRPATIVFRKGGNFIHANALAVPNGTIILTDELVKLTKNDNELLGVLAHEQGHLDQKHSLQQALQSLGITILYVALTGDSSDILSGLPLAMVSAKYSQNFELQADQHAIAEMRRLNISPKYLADFLQRLSQESGEDQDASDFLQSHPATAKRITQIEAQSP